MTSLNILNEFGAFGNMWYFPAFLTMNVGICLAVGIAYLLRLLYLLSDTLGVYEELIMSVITSVRNVKGWFSFMLLLFASIGPFIVSFMSRCII